MWRFLSSFGGGLILCSVAWLFGIQAQRNAPTETSRWVFDAYQLKFTAAQAVHEPRILVVAGSNALFGIDSGQLEAAWGIPTFNLSINAGLGLPYILEISRRVARPRDIILLPIEYGLFLSDGNPSAQIIDYVIARDLVYLDHLDWISRLRFAVWMTPERWVHGLRGLPDHPILSGTYGIHHINKKGDQTHTGVGDRSAADEAAVLASRVRNYGARDLRERGNWALLADYSDWARKNAICLIAVPSAFMHKPEYETDPVEHNFYETLPARVRATGIPYYGHPKDFMYSADRFFNTDYHLLDWARNEHTAQIIKLIGKNPETYCSKQALSESSDS